MIIYHKKNIATFVGAHVQLSMLQSVLQQRIVSSVLIPPEDLPNDMMVGL